jgi:hypothetical protein
MTCNQNRGSHTSRTKCYAPWLKLATILTLVSLCFAVAVHRSVQVRHITGRKGEAWIIEGRAEGWLRNGGDPALYIVKRTNQPPVVKGILHTWNIRRLDYELVNR